MVRYVLISLFLAKSLLFGQIYATYETKAMKEANLAMTSQGIVNNILVDIGSSVKKSQLLLSLDNEEELILLQIAKDDELFLQEQYERHKNSSMSVDKNTLQRLFTELKKAKNSVLVNQTKISKMSLKAPFDGVISAKSIELGDMVGGQVLFKLVSNEKKLLLSFDSKFAKDVKVGDEFCYKVGDAKESTCTTIFKLYPVINSENRKFYAEAYGTDLLIGSFGDGYIEDKK